MTLAELADYICHKIGQPDEDSMAQCKRFLRARYNLIWDSAPWRESLVIIPALSGANAAGFYDQLLLPPDVERVLKVRAGSGVLLDHLELATPFSFDPGLFERAGGVIAFSEMAPAVHAGPFDIVALGSYDGDAGSLGSLYDNAYEQGRLLKATVTMANQTILAENSGRRDLVIVNTGSRPAWLAVGTPAVAGQGIALQGYGGSWEISAANMSFSAISAVTASGSTSLSIQEGAVEIAQLDENTGVKGRIVATASNAAALPDNLSGYSDARVAGGFSQRVQELPLGETAGYWTIPGGFEILSVTKPVTKNGVLIAVGSSAPGSVLSIVGTIAPDETEARRSPRIKLHQVPAGQQTGVLALCKRRRTELMADLDSPGLRNCENALLAYATSDMLERQRQYAKAQAKLQEAGALMAVMHDLELNQSATDLRIIPADIHREAMSAGGGFGGGGNFFW